MLCYDLLRRKPYLDRKSNTEEQYDGNQIRIASVCYAGAKLCKGIYQTDNSAHCSITSCRFTIVYYQVLGLPLRISPFVDVDIRGGREEVGAHHPCVTVK